MDAIFFSLSRPPLIKRKIVQRESRELKLGARVRTNQGDGNTFCTHTTRRGVWTLLNSFERHTAREFFFFFLCLFLDTFFILILRLFVLNFTPLFATNKKKELWTMFHIFVFLSLCSMRIKIRHGLNFQTIAKL